MTDPSEYEHQIERLEIVTGSLLEQAPARRLLRQSLDVLSRSAPGLEVIERLGLAAETARARVS
jgi:hypothetical protein